ncbi:MAG: hypothetical protein LBG08_04910, partial [Spirochaetaceae bacterium]|nr:hypothetical protein [Spirochaetaceae bacterium]
RVSDDTWLNKLDPKNSLFVDASGTAVTAVVYNPYDDTKPETTWKNPSSRVSLTGSEETRTIKAKAGYIGKTADITVSADFNGKTYSATCDATGISGFISVTNITEAPILVDGTASTTLMTGLPTLLTGTVSPSTSTNKTITWGIVSSDTAANIDISESTITAQAKGTAQNAASVGTVTVRATVKNGVWDGTRLKDFTKDFTLSVYPYPNKISVYAVLCDTSKGRLTDTKGSCVLIMSVTNKGISTTPHLNWTSSIGWVKYYVEFQGVINGASYPITWIYDKNDWTEGDSEEYPANSERIFLSSRKSGFLSLGLRCGDMEVSNNIYFGGAGMSSDSL